MPKQPELEQIRVHLQLNAEDWEWVSKHYGRGSAQPGVGANGWVRKLVHGAVTRLKAAAREEAEKQNG